MVATCCSCRGEAGSLVKASETTAQSTSFTRPSRVDDLPAARSDEDTKISMSVYCQNLSQVCCSGTVCLATDGLEL